MGQIIDFGDKITKDVKQNLKELDIIRLLPKLRSFRGENIVIFLEKSVINDGEVLSKVLREVVILKCMEVRIVLVLDVDEQMRNFCRETYGVDDIFTDKNVYNLRDNIDVIDVICKREVMYEVSNILNSFNAMSLCCSGHSICIVFPDDAVNNGISVFDKPYRDINSGTEHQTQKIYSFDMLDELLKTNIIPVLAPTVYDRLGKQYLVRSEVFSAYISGYLSSLKYVAIYKDYADIPTNCLYGVSRMIRILKAGVFSANSLQLINAGIEAINKGSQGAHIINANRVSLLEELCGKRFNGLFLYDDNLNHL